MREACVGAFRLAWLAPCIVRRREKVTMPKYDAYLLRIWHDANQWAARLDHLPDGAVLRFTNSTALLAYLDGARAAGPTGMQGPPPVVIDGAREEQKRG
jgi:hypothetical protein